MPVHFKLTGGYFRGGKIYGSGELYTENDDGEGEIYKGVFLNGKLNDVNGAYITYNNTSYKMYMGTFIEHKMDGTIDVLEYETKTPEINDEKKETGNGVNGNNGRRFIDASKKNKRLSGRKKQIIFSDGVEGATITNNAVHMKINITQKDFNNKKIFTDFSIEED